VPAARRQKEAATMQYQLYPSLGQWRWRLKASNGEIIASGESYVNKQDCVNVVNLVMNTTNKTEFVEVSQ
jgi:uncharacterized protein YegP (UPF0339 family)